MTHLGIGLPGRMHEMRSGLSHLLASPPPSNGDFRGVLFSGMSKYVALNLSSLAIGYVSQLLVARWVGTSDYGFYSLAMTMAALLAHIGTLGFPTALDRFLPQYAEDGDWHLFRGLLRRGVWVAVQVGFVIFLISLPIIYFSDFPPIEKICLVIGMLLVPILGCSDLFSGALQSLKRITAAYLPDEVLAPLAFLGVIAAMKLTFDDLDAIHMLSAMLLVQLFTVLVQSGWLRAVLPKEFFAAKAKDKFSKWLKTAVPVLFMTVFGIVVYRADLLLVGLLMGRTQAGIYAAVITTSELIGVFLKGARAVGSPHIAPLAKKGDTAALQTLMTQSARFAFVPAVLGAGVCVMFGNQLLGMFGSDFTVGYDALVVLAISQAGKAFFGGPAILLLLSGRQVAVAKIYLVAMVFDVALQVVLIRQFGLVGAAAASMITVISAQLLQMGLAAREMGIYTSIIGPLVKRA